MMGFKIALIILFLSIRPWVASGAVTGEIRGQGGERFPIAVSPLKNTGGNTADSARLSTGIADLFGVQSTQVQSTFFVTTPMLDPNSSVVSNVVSPLCADWKANLDFITRRLIRSLNRACFARGYE